MKVTIDIPDEEYFEFVKEHMSDTLDYASFTGDKYNKLIDFIISKVDYKVDHFDAKKQIIADVVSALLLKFGITTERLDLLTSDGFFYCAELANVLQTGGKYVWVMNEESVPIIEALDSYIEEGYEPVSATADKVAKALNEEYFKEVMENERR